MLLRFQSSTTSIRKHPSHPNGLYYIPLESSIGLSVIAREDPRAMIGWLLKSKTDDSLPEPRPDNFKVNQGFEGVDFRDF